MQTGASAAPKAGFWIRFVAYFLDGLILGIPSIILLVIVGGALSSNGRSSGAVLLVDGLLTVAGIAYFIYFWTRPEGQTLGMKAVHIRVVKTDGSQLTVGTAAVRYLGMIVSALVLYIGFIWAAFDSNKQGWHDKIAGTYVVKTG
jgi:uncharacterized RDD family membrane protein YckC